MQTASELFETLSKSNIAYHYTTALTALEHILPLMNLRFNPLAQTNDPLEYKYNPPIAIGSSLPSEDEYKIVVAMNRIAEIRRTKYQMLSFSMNKDENIPVHSFDLINQYQLLGCCKSRMWSQYGESHKGVAIALDLDKLVSSAKNALSDENRVTSSRVTYKAISLRSEAVIDADALQRDDLESFCDKFVARNIMSMFFYKDPDYRDEDEHRIMINPPSNERVYVNIKDAVLAVIIGDRFPDGLLPSIFYICQKSKVPLRRAWWESGYPTLLNPVPLAKSLKLEWEDLYHVKPD